jgi:flagellar basal body-associated protein FliL
MDNQILLIITGIVIFVFIIYMTFSQSATRIVQTKDEKRDEILTSYKKEMQDVLQTFDDDNKMRIAKKSFLLKKFSDELSRNIFFDNNEIKDIILELSKE